MPREPSLFPELHQGAALLSEAEILYSVKNGMLIVESTFDESCLQATSYDIRAGNKGIVGGQGNVIDLTKESLVIDPGSYAGIISLEKIALPKKVVAQIGAKRKSSYEGLILLTGSIIDPGYEGHLLFGLYNASTNKVVIAHRRKICTIVFFELDKEQKPVPADSALLRGDFPTDFVNKMANMEVLPWAQISSEVRHIQTLTQQVLELQAKYNDVLEPIKVLTANVDKVSANVGILTKDLERVAGQVNTVQTLTSDNAKQVNELVTGIRLLTGEVSKLDGKTTRHETELRDVSTKVSRFSLLMYVFWAILLIFLGAVVNKYLLPAIQTPKESPAKPAISAPSSK